MKNELLYIRTNGGDMIAFLNHSDQSAAVFNYPEDIREVSALDQLKAVEDVSSWEPAAYSELFDNVGYMNPDYTDSIDYEIICGIDTDINDTFRKEVWYIFDDQCTIVSDGTARREDGEKEFKERFETAENAQGFTLCRVLEENGCWIECKEEIEPEEIF